VARASIVLIFSQKIGSYPKAASDIAAALMLKHAAANR
jgi:hypothetical protein